MDGDCVCIRPLLNLDNGSPLSSESKIGKCGLTANRSHRIQYEFDMNSMADHWSQSSCVSKSIGSCFSERRSNKVFERPHWTAFAESTSVAEATGDVPQPSVRVSPILDHEVEDVGLRKKKWNWSTSQTVQGNIYVHGANLLLAKYHFQICSVQKISKASSLPSQPRATNATSSLHLPYIFLDPCGTVPVEIQQLRSSGR